MPRLVLYVQLFQTHLLYCNKTKKADFCVLEKSNSRFADFSAVNCMGVVEYISSSSMK